MVSPNFDQRPANTAISLLVLHHISLPPRIFEGEAVISLFMNTLDCQSHPAFLPLQGLQVSSHFFIPRDGSVIQLVGCQERAWHAGVSRWQGRSQCNDFSIGIELEGHEYIAYTEKQYHALTELIRVLKHHYPVESIVGHQDIAPERKTDPGPFFDWQRINTFFIALSAEEGYASLSS